MNELEAERTLADELAEQLREALYLLDDDGPASDPMQAVLAKWLARRREQRNVDMDRRG